MSTPILKYPRKILQKFVFKDIIINLGKTINRQSVTNIIRELFCIIDTQ